MVTCNPNDTIDHRVVGGVPPNTQPTPEKLREVISTGKETITTNENITPEPTDFVGQDSVPVDTEKLKKLISKSIVNSVHLATSEIVEQRMGGPNGELSYTKLNEAKSLATSEQYIAALEKYDEIILLNMDEFPTNPTVEIIDHLSVASVAPYSILYPGETAASALFVYGASEDEISLNINPPEGIDVVQKSQSFDVDHGKGTLITFELTAEEPIEFGEHDFNITVFANGISKTETITVISEPIVQGSFSHPDVVQSQEPTFVGMTDGTQVEIWTDIPAVNQEMHVDVAFLNKMDVNYDIKVTQNNVVVLNEKNAFSKTGLFSHVTEPLQTSEPVDVEITFQGYGELPIEERSGKIGEKVVFYQSVPEFGTIVMMTLIFSILVYWPYLKEQIFHSNSRYFDLVFIFV